MAPEQAFLKFVVTAFTEGGVEVTIGYNMFALGSSEQPFIQTGYRSVPLLNLFSEPLPLSSLLVHVEMDEAVKQPVRGEHEGDSGMGLV